MEIKDSATYPYPIWGVGSDFLGEEPKEGEFNLTPDYNGNVIILDYNITSHNDGIDKLIEEGLAKYICIVECRSTFFLRKYEETKPHFHIEISASDINLHFTFKIGIVACQDIHNCKYLSVDEFYEGTVDYPKGALIGYIDERDVPLDPKEDISDLSKIIVAMASDVDKISYDLDGDKIVVKYPKTKKAKFDLVATTCPSVIESSFVYPALVLALHELSSYHEQEKEWVYYIKLFVDKFTEENNIEISPDYEFQSIEDTYAVAYGLLKGVQIEALDEVNKIVEEQYNTVD